MRLSTDAAQSTLGTHASIVWKNTRRHTAVLRYSMCVHVCNGMHLVVMAMEERHESHRAGLSGSACSVEAGDHQR